MGPAPAAAPSARTSCRSTTSSCTRRRTRRPAQRRGRILVFGQRHVERARDAAFVARARRNAQAGDVAQIETQEPAETRVGLTADTHDALAGIEIESPRD